MFKSIKINKGPVHAGKVFSFNSGETAIVGPNGCGKSLLAEYLAFALFGAVALRGKITDYKDLDVTVDVVIKDKPYKIERSTKTCKLIDTNGETICVGTKPCNIKIIALLGYDFNVYKMGNYAGQLDILGLGKMKPSERKTALDKTLGIGIIDKLIKYANDVALKNRHESDALKSILIDPGQEPIPPAGYDSEALQRTYEQYQVISKSIEDYKNFLAMEQPKKPDIPIKPFDTDLNSKDFLAKVLERQNLETELLSLKSLERSQYTREYLDSQILVNNNYDKYKKYAETIATFADEEPCYTEEKLDAIEVAYKQWQDYDTAINAYALQQVTCPQCGATFNPFKEEPIKPFGSRPILNGRGIQKQRELLAKKKMRESIPVVEKTEQPELSLKTIYSEIEKLDKLNYAWKRIPELEQMLVDYFLYTQTNLEYLQTYEKNFSVYSERKKNFEVNFQKWSELDCAYKNFDLQKKEELKQSLSIFYNDIKHYEEQKKEYDFKYAEYKKVYDKIIEMDKQELRYKTAVDNLKNMKIKIKGYVLPSLQKVSSILLSEMSDGLFNKIEIDPDFNILVEGKEICLFSGSEQAMINLALRLGLGQVLTHKAFSVFIGDEIDASMRNERAQLTADCLRKISKYIKQVILISHRDIEADHFIKLGDE